MVDFDELDAALNDIGETCSPLSWKRFLSNTEHPPDVENETQKADSKSSKPNFLCPSDLDLYGGCPEHDPYCLVICQVCGHIVKPEALQSHIKLRHTVHNRPKTPVESLVSRQVTQTTLVIQRIYDSQKNANSRSPNTTRKTGRDTPSPLLDRCSARTRNSGGDSTPSSRSQKSHSARHRHSRKSRRTCTNKESLGSVHTPSPLPYDIDVAESSPLQTTVISNGNSNQSADSFSPLFPSESAVSGSVNSFLLESSGDDTFFQLVGPEKVESTETQLNELVALSSEPQSSQLHEFTCMESLADPVFDILNNISLDDVIDPASILSINSNSSSAAAVRHKNQQQKSALSSQNSTARVQAQNQSILGETAHTLSATGRNLNDYSDVRTALQIPLKARKYDPDLHCGVIDKQTSKRCLKSINCKVHALSLRHAVEGRSMPFDLLLKALKNSRVAKSRSSTSSNAPTPLTVTTTTTTTKAYNTSTDEPPPIISNRLPVAKVTESAAATAGSVLKPSGLFPLPRTFSRSSSIPVIEPRKLHFDPPDSPLSSDEDMEGLSGQCLYLPYQPRPAAENTYGARLMSHGCYLMNRRTDVLRSAFYQCIQSQLSNPPESSRGIESSSVNPVKHSPRLSTENGLLTEESDCLDSKRVRRHSGRLKSKALSETHLAFDWRSDDNSSNSSHSFPLDECRSQRAAFESSLTPCQSFPALSVARPELYMPPVAPKLAGCPTQQKRLKSKEKTRKRVASGKNRQKSGATYSSSSLSSDTLASYHRLQQQPPPLPTNAGDHPVSTQIFVAQTDEMGKAKTVPKHLPTLNGLQLKSFNLPGSTQVFHQRKRTVNSNPQPFRHNTNLPPSSTQQLSAGPQITASSISLVSPSQALNSDDGFIYTRVNEPLGYTTSVSDDISPVNDSGFHATPDDISSTYM